MASIARSEVTQAGFDIALYSGPGSRYEVRFNTIILFKDQSLGIGAYGTVCKAKCDDLICAAKIIHPTLFDPTELHQIAPHREHRLPIWRFERECEFLSTIRHPNIIQYLGTHQDPDTGLPVLLMELMDENLTCFVESSTQPIPYHIQVNICHDITLGLSFLHSSYIIHRDLSSNNVLLYGNTRAKLTDFGMARLTSLNLHTIHVTRTIHPITDVYMPPEAVQDKPVYTEKLDCFSFGVILVQIMTQQFPKPGNRSQEVNSGLRAGTILVCIPEIERRQNHISQVDPNHPLLPIALDCLKDRNVERPSAQQLCDRVGALKGTAKYKNAYERVKDSSGETLRLQQDLENKISILNEKDAIIAENEHELRQCREELNQQIRQLERDKQQLERERNQTLQENDEKEQKLRRMNQQLEESEQLIAELGKRSTEFQREMNQEIQEKERQLVQINQQLEEHKLLIVGFDKQSTELERERDQEVQEKLEKERQLGQLNQQLEESKRLIAELSKITTELEVQLVAQVTVAQRAQISVVQQPQAKDWEENKEKSMIRELEKLKIQEKALNASSGNIRHFWQTLEHRRRNRGGIPD